jgi:hypothetical protein
MVDISAPTAVRERYITLWHSQTGGQLPAGIHILKHTILVNNRKRTHPSCRVPHDGFSFFPINHIYNTAEKTPQITLWRSQLGQFQPKTNAKKECSPNIASVTKYAGHSYASNSLRPLVLK